MASSFGLIILIIVIIIIIFTFIQYILIHLCNIGKSRLKISSNWGSKHTIKFLEKYQQLPCLWDPSNPDYKSKYTRARALGNLVRSMNIPDFDADAAKSKIHCLRVTYNTEKNKVTKSIKAGCGTAEVYIPKLLWFPLADSFLSKAAGGKEIFIKPEVQKEGNITDCFLSPVLAPLSSCSFLPPDIEEVTQSVKNEGRKRSEKFSHLESAVKTLQSLSQMEMADEGDSFAKYLASILRKLPEADRLELQISFMQMVTNKRVKILRRPSSGFQYLIESPSCNI